MSNRTKGILCIIASAFCFALMSTFVRLSGDLPSVQKSFFRNFVAMFIALAVLLKEGGGLKLQKGCLPLHLLRSIAGTLGILGNFYAVDHLVLSNASMLNKMSPFFVLVFSYFILKEKLKPTQVVIVAVAFLGSLFIIKPVPTNLDVIPSLAGLRFTPMTGYQLAMLLCAGLSAAGGQFTITKAYTFAPAREVSVYDYTQIIFTTVIGYLLFRQKADAWSILGYALIIGAAVVMFLYNNGKLGRPAKERT